MLKMPDGTAVPRPEAQRSLRNALVALAAAGGRPPLGPDGSAMLWNSRRGWVPRGTTRSGGRPLAEFLARQNFRAHQIRQDRLDQEIRADHALLRGASQLAWCYARQFSRAFVSQPSRDAPTAMVTGWRLARRGYDRPPAWLLQEREDPGRGR
jgi:hypothetical protein